MGIDRTCAAQPFFSDRPTALRRGALAQPRAPTGGGTLPPSVPARKTPHAQVGTAACGAARRVGIAHAWADRADRRSILSCAQPRIIFPVAGGAPGRLAPQYAGLRVPPLRRA